MVRMKYTELQLFTLFESNLLERISYFLTFASLLNALQLVEKTH
jgi:hypothetical protein